MDERMMILLNTPVHSISIIFLQNFKSGVNMSSSHQINFYCILTAYPNYLSFLSMQPPYQAEEKR